MPSLAPIQDRRRATRGVLHRSKHCQAVRGQRGITIIELMIALTIVVLVTAAIAVSFNALGGARVRSSAATVAAMMRYLYNEAVVHNTRYRLVLDFDNMEYWGEAMPSNDDPCARYVSEDDDGSELPAPRIVSGEEEGKGSQGERETSDNKDEATKGASGGSFQGSNDRLLKPRKLEANIGFTGVISTHHRSVQNDGRAAIHFFPGGYAERAFIWLGEKDPDTGDYEPLITLKLKSLMGEVNVVNDVIDEGEFFKEAPE